MRHHLKSGEKRTWTYRGRAVNVARKAWFGGEAAVSGARLCDPKIDDWATSCR
jgi:hypothetical protein